MKKAPQNKVPYFQCRFDRRHNESSSTQKKHKQEMGLDDRPEREGSLSHLYNPSAPFNDEELADFIETEAQILEVELNQLGIEGAELC